MAARLARWEESRRRNASSSSASPSVRRFAADPFAQPQKQSSSSKTPSPAAAARATDEQLGQPAPRARRSRSRRRPAARQAGPSRTPARRAALPAADRRPRVDRRHEPEGAPPRHRGADPGERGPQGCRARVKASRGCEDDARVARGRPRCGGKWKTRSCSGAASKAAGPRGPPRGVPGSRGARPRARATRTGAAPAPTPAPHRRPERQRPNVGNCIRPAVVPRAGTAGGRSSITFG